VRIWSVSLKASVDSSGEPENYELKQALAAAHGVAAENIVVGEVTQTHSILCILPSNFPG
jgi:ribosomal protein S24E